MLSLESARALKEAGLSWQPQLLDCFMIPDIGLDERVFVITDMVVTLEVLDGLPAISFSGAVEWALDHVWQADAIWIPTESQLRHLLLSCVPPTEEFRLERRNGDFVCCLGRQGASREYQAAQAEEAYAQALLAHWSAPTG